MILSDLIAPLPRAVLTGSADCEVSGVQDDSRLLQPGDVFVAVKGHTVDGHDFADRAVSGGARVIVAETPAPLDLPEGVNWPKFVGMGLAAGIGFTVSIFVGNLAFDDPAITELAKIGILVASLIAAIGALALLRFGEEATPKE